MADKTINELNKDVLEKNQEKDDLFEKQQAELFRVVYGVPPENSVEEVPEENQEVEEVEEAEEEVEEVSAPEQSEGIERQSIKEGTDYQKLYNESQIKIQQLEKTISDLNQKIQSFGTLNNLINDLGLKDATQEQVQTVVANIRQVADDLYNVPSLGQVLN
ncbi:MAG: hypothetical protein QXU40_03015, partial [Candidatus Pacearchaeota archaeon]